MAQLTQLAQDIGLLKQKVTTSSGTSMPLNEPETFSLVSAKIPSAHIQRTFPPILPDVVTMRNKSSLNLHDVLNSEDSSQRRAQLLRHVETKHQRDLEEHETLFNAQASVYATLEKVVRMIKHYSTEDIRLSRIAKIASITVKILSVMVAIAMLIGIDQRQGGAQVENSLYYFATCAAITVFFLLQVRDTWAFQQRATVNRVTVKALQVLHEDMLHQITSDHPTLADLMAMKSDLKTRIAIIRSSAEGYFYEASLPLRPV